MSIIERITASECLAAGLILEAVAFAPVLPISEGGNVNFKTIAQVRRQAVIEKDPNLPVIQNLETGLPILGFAALQGAFAIYLLRRHRNSL
jgi:hypothetical protein